MCIPDTLELNPGSSFSLPAPYPLEHAAPEITFGGHILYVCAGSCSLFSNMAERTD